MAKKENDGYELVPNNWVKWSVVGNNIFGTLTAVREIPSQLKPGTMSKVYEIKADGGEFNDTKDKKILEPALEILAGEIWNVGGRMGLDAQFRNIKLGQKVKLVFTEERPNKDKLKNATKIVNVYVKKDAKGQPVYDEVWLKEQAGTYDKAEEEEGSL